MDKESKDPIIHLVNEYYEKFLKVSVDYYITLHYLNERKPSEAFFLCQHTLEEVENTIDFYSKAGIPATEKRAAEDFAFL